MTAADRSLSGASALVTGATSGLGRATALRLAVAGADVALVGRRAQDLAEVADPVAGHGVRALSLAADLADTGSLPALVDRVDRELGGLGVLVNAAATDAPGRAEDLALEDWERVVAVNLTAPFVLARAAFPTCVPRAAVWSSTCRRWQDAEDGARRRRTAPPSSR